jgi:hypothetical protein
MILIVPPAIFSLFFPGIEQAKKSSRMGAVIKFYLKHFWQQS